MRLAWSDWKPLSGLTTKGERRQILGRPGVYQIRWAIAGKPGRINRANGTDEDGILYIGSSSNLGNRIGNHASIAKGRVAGTFARTYSLFNYGRKFRADQVEIRWAEVSEYETAEKELLNNYLKEFLDTPPVNLRLGRLRPRALKFST